MDSARRSLGSSFVEVMRFPWRQPHHSMVDIEQRRARLEAYLSVLFTQNMSLQTHALTQQFFIESDCADPSMGLEVLPQAPASRARPRTSTPPRAEGDGAVTSRFVMSPMKHLLTIIVACDTEAAMAQTNTCASQAAQAALETAQQALGGDLSDTRLISLAGAAPFPVAQAVAQAFMRAMGEVRGRPAVSTEPNLQLLRALHFHDAAGEGVLSTFRMGQILGQLGVHLPPDIASDLLLQVTRSERCSIFHGVPP